MKKLLLLLIALNTCFAHGMQLTERQKPFTFPAWYQSGLLKKNSKKNWDIIKKSIPQNSLQKNNNSAQNNSPEKVKECTNLFLRSEEYKKHFPQGVNQTLKEYMFVNDFKEKVELKNTQLENDTIYENYSKLCPKLSSKDDPFYKKCFILNNSHITRLLDFKKTNNYQIFLVNAFQPIQINNDNSISFLHTIDNFECYDIYDNANNHVTRLKVPEDLWTVDCFTASQDNTIFFTIGSDSSNKKWLMIQTRYKDPYQENDKQDNLAQKEDESDYYITTPLELESDWDIKGIEFHTNGKLALLKKDDGVFFMDLKRIITQNNSPEKVKERTNLFLRSEEYKNHFPQGVNQTLKEYIFANDFNEKVELKNRQLENETIENKYQRTSGKKRFVDYTKIKDFLKTNNYQTFLVEQPGFFTDKYIYDIYDNVNNYIKRLNLPYELKTVDCFTVAQDNKIFFAIGSDSSNKKWLMIQTRHKDPFLEKAKKQGALVEKVERETYITTPLELENTLDIKGIEFHTNGKLALLKKDGGVFFMDLKGMNIAPLDAILKKYPKPKAPKKIIPAPTQPNNQENSKQNKNKLPMGFYTKAGVGSAATLFGIGLLWYYNPYSIVDTLKEFTNSWVDTFKNSSFNWWRK